MHRGRAAVERAGKRVSRFDDHVVTPYRSERSVKQLLARAASGERHRHRWTLDLGSRLRSPVLASVSSVGHRPLRARAPSAWSRCPVAAQQAWYEGIARTYVEIFDLVEPAEFAAHATARRDARRPEAAHPVEFRSRADCARDVARLGLEGAGLWHPGLMYQLFRSFWYGDRSRHFLFRHTDFRYPRTVVAADELSLPGEYVAMKFYTGPALPDTEMNRALVRDLVERVAARTPVVMLDTAWSDGRTPGLRLRWNRGCDDASAVARSEDQSRRADAVIAGARQFIGTCGGLAWLAPFLGVDTLAVYEDDRYLTAHLYAARYAYRRTGAARFSTLNISALRDR